ncbi:MAG: hypothetical protein M3O82_02810 [Verrucomicrobiota bacterium]|nr:hypothetical protein [Verrucomicrobiota bacterium]
MSAAFSPGARKTWWRCREFGIGNLPLNVENVQEAFGAKTTKIEAVAHGKGLGMLLVKTSTELKAKLEKLHAVG